MENQERNEQENTPKAPEGRDDINPGTQEGQVILNGRGNPVKFDDEGYRIINPRKGKVYRKPEPPPVPNGKREQQLSPAHKNLVLEYLEEEPLTSLIVICDRLGITVQAFRRACQDDENLRDTWEEIQRAREANIQEQLYAIASGHAARFSPLQRWALTTLSMRYDRNQVKSDEDARGFRGRPIIIEARTVNDAQLLPAERTKPTSTSDDSNLTGHQEPGNP